MVRGLVQASSSVLVLVTAWVWGLRWCVDGTALAGRLVRAMPVIQAQDGVGPAELAPAQLL